MDQPTHKGLTLIQWMSLVALLGLILTIAAALWQGPQPGNDTAQPPAGGPVEPQ